MKQTKILKPSCKQAFSQDRWGVRDPPKMDFLNLTPLNLLQQPHFCPFGSYKWTFWRISGDVSHPLATGLVLQGQDKAIV